MASLGEQRVGRAALEGAIQRLGEDENEAEEEEEEDSMSDRWQMDLRWTPDGPHADPMPTPPQLTPDQPHIHRKSTPDRTRSGPDWVHIEP